ncbi:hypothetical protein C8A03DRAFT_28875 [Achaetomium macrosporum]|uniref:Uncharacterized protein n=1 Tax=Achaetomium macrosporum TaxID=79813 RepID=A0AAN7CKC9_9PEZI|nr:hypothetical protein C8A03DRAFT_28875 [Achaetomium macrosporum]
MKFAIATVLAFAAVAFAYPAVGNGAPVKRQNINNVDPAVPAMSDASGNIVPFESTQVHQDAKAKGI